MPSRSLIPGPVEEAAQALAIFKRRLATIWASATTAEEAAALARLMARVSQAALPFGRDEEPAGTPGCQLPAPGRTETIRCREPSSRIVRLPHVVACRGGRRRRPAVASMVKRALRALAAP